MDPKGTIRAYRQVLNSFRFSKPESFSEDFAQKRFLKKYQEPDSSRSESLHLLCWDDWIKNDESLPSLRNRTLLPEWYIARASLHEALRGFQPGEFSFPKGSEFTPTRGRNSLEARLCSSDWTCTYENFEAFSKLCYSHAGLKRATRKRYSSWYKRRGFDITRRSSDKFLYGKFSGSSDIPFSIFTWKLSRVVNFVRGSRFSTVPKNNEKRRPINIEPFANILTQSSLGDGFRSVLRRHYNVDLDQLQHVHRRRISDMNVATIDLSNASDSISLDLCRFLLPKGVFTKLLAARSDLILGPDGNYYCPRKISSMGNGFTFELMSLILTSIARVLDPDSSVYGDDIIIKADKASRLLELLEDVGLKVNRDKTFTDGPFRESCGGNYHEAEGYIKSFDFLYPESINDCMLILNKAYYLKDYPSFRKLYHSLVRVTPHALHGGPCPRFSDLHPLDVVGVKTREGTTESTVVFPPFFVTPKIRSFERISGTARERLSEYGYDPSDFHLVVGYEYVSVERSPQLKHLPSSRWAKYLMYLAAGGRCKDVLSSVGHWKKYYVATSGTEYFRVSPLKS